MAWELDADRPIYAQLVERIQREIVSGKYQPGEKLPSVRDLAAVAAVLYSSTYPLINPYMGSMLGLRAFIAAVIGGIGVIPGAMIGGFIIGIAEALIKRYISSAMADAIVFALLIVVLLVKPSGLLGRHEREKV